MNVEFKEGEGLYIKDKTDEDVFAVLDYRDSTNGELRGSNLAKVLQEYAKTNKEGSVYDALNKILRSHHNPTFASGATRLGVEEWALGVVFSAIDTVLGWANKLKPAKSFTSQDNENQQQIGKKFPRFLTILDEKNIAQLKSDLESTVFSEKQFASARKNAVEKLLTYRRTLFDETDTVGINLKDSRKASKCHFSEQMITALVKNEPQPGQNFGQYITSCIKKAEANLTSDEVKSWPKGVFSHRLYDIVSELKKMNPEQQPEHHHSAGL